MCGICGFIRFRDEQPANVLQLMADAIRHRGPDDEGYLCLDRNNDTQLYSGNDSVPEIKQQLLNVQNAGHTKLGFGFRRLSILDLSHKGHQPMLTEDKQFAIVFNGEIYNHNELRKELQTAGLTFQSASDTEVILLGYKHWGIKVLQRLNGMFAFAIYDQTKNIVLLARDRLGIKPLFYHRSEQGITWASEIKAILKSGLVKADISWQGLQDNYMLMTTPSPSTCFEDIFSVAPGSFIKINCSTGELKHEKYWQIPISTNTITISKQEAAELLDKKLQEIVRIQLRADVPVTSLMSGGIDSTTLTAICAQQHPDFHAYSLGFDGTGNGVDELPQAIAMAKMLGIKHHVHQVKPGDVLSTLDASLRHFEEPYVDLEPGLAASAYLHDEGYKVVMNGLGADEVFGGYAYYTAYRQWLQRKKWFFLKALIPTGDKKLKDYFGLDSAWKYYVHMHPGMKEYEANALTGKQIPVLKNDVPGNVLEQLFYYDLNHSIGSHHVYRDDLSAMKHSVEVRYPYLDHELIEWVAMLPLSVRYDAKTTKPLLKETAKKYITEQNLSMSKKGFMLPLQKWMQQDQAMQDYCRKQLDNLKKRGIFNNDIIERWWQLRNSGTYFSNVWQLVTTEVWLDEYLSSK